MKKGLMLIGLNLVMLLNGCSILTLNDRPLFHPTEHHFCGRVRHQLAFNINHHYTQYDRVNYARDARLMQQYFKYDCEIPL